jgi:hypothetical protein
MWPARRLWIKESCAARNALALLAPFNQWRREPGQGARLARQLYDYDLGYFDDETCRLEPIKNPFGPKVLPMSPE